MFLRCQVGLCAGGPISEPWFLEDSITIVGLSILTLVFISTTETQLIQDWCPLLLLYPAVESNDG